MKTVATKIKTVAVAAALVAGISAGAAAQEAEPFVSVPKSPNTQGQQFAPKTTPTAPGDQFGRKTIPTNPFGTERKDNYNNMDSRLTRYLVGVWSGRLSTGHTVKVAFRKDGGFAIAVDGSNVAQVGRYTVQNGQIRLRLAAMCSLTTKRCQRYNQVRAMTIGFRPMNARSFQVRDGILHRTA